MPTGRKITPTERREWLEAFDKGETKHDIARAAKVRTPTVDRGIALAREESEVEAARQSLRREALQRHNQQLLDALAAIVDQLVVLPEDRYWLVECYRGRSSRAPLLDERVTWDRELETAVGRFDPPGREQARLRQLLQEHLKEKRNLWRAIGEWQQHYVEYAGACIRFGNTACKLLIDGTRLPVEPADSNREGLHEDAVVKLCRAVLDARRAGGSVPEPLPLRLEQAQVHWDGGVVATVQDSVKRRKLPQQLLGVAEQLLSDRDGAISVREKEALESDAKGLAAALTDLKLYGLIGGSCTVCRP